MEHKMDIKGFSTFMYFAIPLVLAIAAVWWLAFGQGLHYFRRGLSQEKRRNEVVGAKILPQEPIKIRLKNLRDDAVQIERADIDGGDLYLYYRNKSHSRSSSIRFEWRLKAPDGTVVAAKDGYMSIYAVNNAPDSLEAGELGEAHLTISPDPRAVVLEVRVR